MNIIIMIIILVIFLYVLIYEFLIPFFKQKQNKKEYIQQNGQKTRKLCIKCKYCVKKKYHPFTNGEYRNAMIQDIPMYCKRFKRQLNSKYDCRCISQDATNAFYEEK